MKCWCAMKSVLFMCTHNSARSQMAEAFLNKLCGDRYEAKSAGVAPRGLNPYVVKAMAEVGVDLTKSSGSALASSSTARQYASAGFRWDF